MRRVGGKWLLSAFALIAFCLLAGGCAFSSGQGVTTAPTVPASATATTQARLVALARQAFGSQVQRVAATYDAPTRTAQVTGTVGTAIPRTAAQIKDEQERIKSLCFLAQRAFWTSGVALKRVVVTILGPTYDDSYDTLIDGYGGATVLAATAATLNWGTLSADAAWARYDQTWVRSSFAPNNLYR